MDYKEFLRESMEKNEQEAKAYLQNQRLKKVQQLSSSNGLPKLFKSKRFNNYNPSDNIKAFQQAKSFVERFPQAKGLLLSGDVGAGKTHLVAAIANELTDKLYTVYFGNVTDILNFVKSTYNKNTTITELEAINLMTKEVDLLIIDDLGKENATENTLSLLYTIINKLYENEKPVLITTNYNSNDLVKKLGERGQATVSRISGMCEPVIVKGKDWRISNGQN